MNKLIYRGFRMRAVIQRVSHASVSVLGETVGKIEQGLLVLFGFLATDDEKIMNYMIEKVVNMRIFEDKEGKMNLSLLDIKGELLIVPNFTLYGDARKGRRPGFSNGAAPNVAENIYKRLIEKAKLLPITVESGIFQADMKVELLNDGPVTLLLDSDKTF